MPLLILRFLLAALTIPALGGCSGDGRVPAPPGATVAAAEGGYRLVYGESEKEVRRVSTGEAAVPWVPGSTATKTVSSLLTVREGFVLPDEFLERWPEELTTFLEEYAQAGGDRPADYG